MTEEPDAPETLGDAALADKLKQSRDRIVQELRKQIVGQDDVVELVLTTLLVGGNSIITGVPGLAKTLLIQSVAQVLDLRFSRIQFTPDLMPSDITGTDLIQEDEDSGQRKMVFAPGPIFANIVLGDEINRASPKTQSALLECMEERQVTVDTETHTLGAPFIVIATQNPIEHEGTYPLPEAQLDRFMLRLAIGYPDSDVEAEILASHASGAPLDDIGPVSDAAGVREMIEEARQIHAAPAIRRYIVDLVEATRKHSDVYLGASPRASIMILRAARALAAAEERDYVIPDDVKTLAPPALSHRIIVTADAIMSGRSADVLVREIVDEVDVPVSENP